MNAEQLSNLYGYWGQHPDHPLDDWAQEASEDCTRLGYWEWVEALQAQDVPD